MKQTHLQLFTLLMAISLLFCLLPPTAAQEPPVKAGAEIDYPPFSFKDSAGNPTGFSIELMRAALAAMNRELVFETGTWQNLRDALARGRLDALPLVGKTPEREPLFDFTFPYMTLHGAIVVRKDEVDIGQLSDLTGWEVAVMRGDNAEEFLRREPYGILIRTRPTFMIALHELAEGKYDAVVVQRLVGLRLIAEEGLSNLKVLNQPIPGFKQDFCFAVTEGDRETLALLNEGLSIVMADGTYRHLHAKWFAALQLPAGRHIIVGGDHNYPPYEYIDQNGRPSGYNVELTYAIAREMNLDIEIRLGPWNETLQALTDGDIDVLQGMFYSPERDLEFDFTPAHEVNHYVAVVRKGERPPPETPAALTGLRIILQKGDIMDDYTREYGLAKQVTALDSQEDALRELSEGKDDCALVSRVTALYLIKKHGWTNLNIAQSPLLSPSYCYATAKGQQALLVNFSEGLRVLQENGEYRHIYEKWLGVYHENPLSLLEALRYSAIVLIPLLLVLFAGFVWSWTLRRQVARKTRELKESLELHKAIITCSPVALYSINLAGFVQTWNVSAERIFGWSAEEVLGKPLPIIPEDKQKEFAELRRRAVNGDVILGEQLTRLQKDGSLIPISLSVAIIRNQRGESIGIMGAALDISEQKKAEITLRAIFESMRDGVLMMDVEKRTFVIANPAICKMLGYPHEELLGLEPHDIHPASARKEVKALIEKQLRGEMLLAPDVPLLRKDGQIFLADISTATLTLQGREFLLGIFRDVTEQKQAEEAWNRLQAQLVHARKMESVGRLAGGVAHDYNNMLSVIIGYAEAARQNVDPADPIADDLDHILTAAARSRDITRQLLAFARKETTIPEVLDVNASVEGMLAILRRLIGEDIDLVYRPGSNVWPVLIDPTQLDQVLANLCVNGRDAIEDVGTITIETGTVCIDQATAASNPDSLPGEFVLLSVSDTGSGMDQDMIDKVFEPFFTTKEMGSGTGLGLATVYGIVTQNKGFIRVSSRPGAGTTFQVHLPRYAGDLPVKHRHAADSHPVGRGETLLVVEDEAAILQLAERILTRLGYHVLSSRTPAEALRTAETCPDPISLLVTDVVMPEMNGRELAERLRQRHPALKCLFMSGYTSDVIAHRGLHDHGFHFIQKPFTQKDIAVKVRAVLDESASS
ncbi:MAG TPA: transporter substrate-binding domain-containing protein [Spirochaetia bacterium]|nr:transporter substrate-binding domain-containing protein [Spirochaetia bacterium]